MAIWPWRKAPGPAPNGDPETITGFLNRVVSDWDCTLRFIAIASSLLFVSAAGITVGIGVLVIATEGLRGITPRYAVPAGLLTGAPLVTLIMATISGLVRRRRDRAANGSKAPSTR